MDIDLDTGLPIPDHSDERPMTYQERKAAGAFPTRSRAKPKQAPPAPPRRPAGRPRKTSTGSTGRNYAPQLAELMDTAAFACGMMPFRPVQAQGAIFALNGPGLADGLNIAANANPYIRRGVEWLTGTEDSDGGGGAGAIIVALACVAPFAMNTYLIWNPPSAKKNPDAHAEREKMITYLAEAAEKASKNRMESAMKTFTEAQQAMREESGDSDVEG